MSMSQQHCNEINKETEKFIGLDGGESKCCVKVDAYQILINNIKKYFLDKL